MSPRVNNRRGFTLIELMIYTAIFGVVIAAVLATYRSQLRTQVVQREKIDMQQNLRAALYLMDREIKTAGLNPAATAGIGIILADAHSLQFSLDFAGGAADGADNDDDGLIDEGEDGIDNNGNGLTDEPDEAEWYDGDALDAEENVTYILSNDADANGRNDGLPTENDDGGTCNLLRNNQPIALNVDALNFVYLDENGAALATPVSADDLLRIRSIQVTLVARSGETVSYRTQLDSRTYQNQQGVEILGAQNDAFRRLALGSEIRCRNLGL